MLFVLSGGNPPQVAPPIPYVDKLQHFVAYALLGVLLARALAKNVAPATRAPLVAAALIAAAYGVTDEIHQSFTPGRFVEVADAVADAAGGFAGAFAWAAWMRRRSVAGAANA